MSAWGAALDRRSCSGLAVVRMVVVVALGVVQGMWGRCRRRGLCLVGRLVVRTLGMVQRVRWQCRRWHLRSVSRLVVVALGMGQRAWWQCRRRHLRLVSVGAEWHLRMRQLLSSASVVLRG